MFRILSAAGVALAASSLVGAPALAQTSDSATVNAVATIVEALVPMDVTAVRGVEFGTVYSPNGSTTGNICQYSINGQVDNLNDGAIAIAEYTSANSLVGDVGPTTSGCDQSGAVQTAQFSVTCDASTPVNFTVSSTSASLTGVTFVDNGTSIFAGGTRTAYTPSSGASTGTATTACDTDGVLDVAVGGSINIEETAIAATDTVVGTVTIDASY